MTHRIVNTVRSLALYGAVTLGLRKARIEVREPEAIRCGAELEEISDSWMFDHPQTAVSAQAYVLEQEYNKVSGVLSGLRAVLSSLSKMPLSIEPAYEAIATPAGVSFDPTLFDEVAAPIPVLTNVVAFDEDDLFIETGLTLQKPSAPIESLPRVA
jgi:hypothetical protein